LREIFSLIFPELRYFERLEKLDTISTQNDFDIKTLVAVLLVDETNNHEYFSHKYNVSNNIKDYLHLLAKNYIISKDDRNFFDKDLKKNVYYFGKEHLKVLNILNFTNRKKFKLEDYMEKLSIIRKTSLPKFPFDGNYLKKRGVKEGEVIGRILKLLELEWLDNNFKISNQRISNIIDEQIS
jgi:tRNA nucleotidyltransferase/poly(A) polymerase